MVPGRALLAFVWMIAAADFRKIVKARLKDAEVLLSAGRFDGAVYLCGYSVEIALKARVCRSLKWDEFPSTTKEFQGYHSFKTHNLDVLLHLSGAEKKIKSKHLTAWSFVTRWEPDTRYKQIAPQL